MHRAYFALSFICAPSIGCADPSCPEGQTKIGNVCHRFGDANASSAEGEPDAEGDAEHASSARSDSGSGGSDGSINADGLGRSDAATGEGVSGMSDSGSGGTGVDATIPSLCTTNNGGCDPRTACSVVAGSVTCGACPDGFSGDGATGCVQAPVCSENPCGANAACAASTMASGYTCSCKEGFTLAGKTCVDIDECVEGTNICHITAKCENTVGSYECTCPQGYSGGTRAGFACAPRIAAGLQHTCVLLSSGQVQCWGDNSKGQLGNVAIRIMPVFVLDLENVVAISASNGTATCALIDDGTVKCWGDNAQGQLGIGTTTGISMSPTLVSGLSDVIAIGAGPQHACAVTKSGAVQCWGNDGTGARLSAGGISGIPSAATVGLGFTHTCAVTASGEIWCWGNNEYGQLGAGHTNPTQSPIKVLDVQDARYVVAGIRHTCSLSDAGAVTCWGLGAVERTAVIGLGSAVSASAGLYNSCAVEQDGAVSCWLAPPDVTGRNGTTTNPVDAVAVAIAGDSWHACALVASGAVRCGGNNDSGQLGDGTTASTERSGVLTLTTATGVDAW